jgi:hypothetical protein
MRWRIGQTLGLLVAALSAATIADAETVLFDFDNAPLHAPLPLDVTAGPLTAHLSATGEGFSIQTADVLGFTPAGFSGYAIYPSSVFAADLLVTFSSPVQGVSILYAPEEYACDSSATLRITAYLGVTFVGTATATAPAPGTWPTGTLAIATMAPFDNVVIHYESPPPTGGDWGPVFMADNMSVTTSDVLFANGFD